jgi:hypothetical protein
MACGDEPIIKDCPCKYKVPDIEKHNIQKL